MSENLCDSCMNNTGNCEIVKNFGGMSQCYRYINNEKTNDTIDISAKYIEDYGYYFKQKDIILKIPVENIVKAFKQIQEELKENEQ